MMLIMMKFSFEICFHDFANLFHVDILLFSESKKNVNRNFFIMHYDIHFSSKNNYMCIYMHVPGVARSVTDDGSLTQFGGCIQPRGAAFYVFNI